MYGIVNHGPNRYELQADGRRVAVVDDWNEARAFAALPELLTACKAMIQYRDSAGALGFQLEKADDIIHIMRTAVEKAEGK